MATFQVTSDNSTTATIVTATPATFSLDGALRGPKGDDGVTPPDATTIVKGKIKLAGDLGGTADLPTVIGLSDKAADSAVVHNTGNETIAGIKTFSSSPIAPAPASSTQVATKGYVDSVASSGSTPDADATTKGKVQLGGELSGVGSTATAPTIKNMLRVFNVKDYGAIGDGSTDDLTAIQNAINAATSVGGIVFFPAATYIVSNSIVPKSNVTLQGVQNVSILKMSAATGRTIKLLNAALTNFTIDSMTFSGSVNSFPTVPTRTRTISGNGAETAVYITGDQDPFTGGTGAISNITLRNCKIQNHSALPIRISGTTGTVKVVDCDFINNQDPGFIFNDEVIFNNNHCMNGADNGVSLSRGNKKVTCVGNTIESVAFQGIFIAGFDINGDGDIQNAGPTNFTITGNTIKNCGYNGIYADAAPKHGVISGNVVQQGYYRGPVGSTTITVGSNGATLPQTTVNVVSTIGFSGSGSFTLNSETITYTGITSTTFTGCSGGTSTLTTGDTVSILKTDINSTGIYIAGYPFPYNQTATIAAESNGLTLPQATITVASTSSFPSIGSFTLNSETITYTGKTSTTFTGCSGGTSTMATGNTVTMIPSAYAENIQVTGNTLYQCARAGIELFAAKHIAIDSNLIVDCGTEFLADGTTTIGSTSVASNVGILIHSAGTPVDISVRNNTITETRTGSVSNTNGQYTNYGIVPYTNIPSTYTYANNRMSGCRNAYNITDWSSDNHIYSGNGAIIQTKGLNDPHDNRVMTITDNASTTPNFLNVQGSIAGQAVALSAESFTETVIPFTIRSKGAATFAIRPGADLATAIQFRRANSNPAVSIDTNRGDNLSRVGVNTAAPASEMHVVGDVRSTNLILTNPLSTTYGGTGQANLTSLPLTTPQITNGLNDSNGNRMITFTAVGSAVTNLTLQNAATGGNVAIAVSSTDTNAGVALKGKGTGIISFRPETDTILAAQFRRADNLSANSVLDVDTSNARVGINTIAPTSDLEVNGKITTSTLKMTTSPTTGYVLTATDGTGNMSWQTAVGFANPMTTQGDVIYGGSSGMPTRLAAGSSTQVFLGGTTPSWGTVVLTSMVSGSLPIANGGTGQTNANAGFNALSPMTTAGDIIYGGTSGAGTRLAAGSSSQLLIGGTTPAWGAVALASMVSGTLPVANGGIGQTSLTSLPLTTPQITNGINDSNGNRIVSFTATASAVTNLTIQNAATGGNIAFGVSSSDTNAGATFKSKGNGTLVFRPETDTSIASQWRKADNTTVVMDVDTTNTRVGIGTAAPTRTLDVVGATRVQQLLGSSASSPSNAADVGAGISPTITITGTDVAGKIVVTAGVSPSASAAIIKLTFGTTYPNAPYPMLVAGNTSAAALSGTASVYVTSNATDFTISVGSTALVSATQYIWYYHIMG